MGPDNHMERLRLRRQFVLGDRFVESFPSWRRLEVRPGVRLTVHPDLPSVSARRAGMTVALLGYVLDPYQPRATDLDIVSRLVSRIEPGMDPASLIQLTYAFGGRWILLVDDGRSAWMFNDPCGYRQIFYADAPRHGRWCASQPGLLADILGLPRDPKGTRFIETFRRQHPEYWWPIDTSPYDGIRRLVPNHYLDLETGTTHRFWPIDGIPPRPLEEVAVESADLLRRLIESASYRFKLALGITAGKDTRLLLAASGSLRERLFYFTTQYWDLDSRSPDIWVPARLLPQLGLSHHIIPCPPRMRRDFAEIFRQNVATAHEAYGPIAEGMYRRFPQDRVSMKGSAIPVTGAYYKIRLEREMPDASRNGIDGTTLARLARMPCDAFALDALSRWLEEVEAHRVDGLDVLDLFLWEDREGSWQATSQLEFDIVRDSFVPYNCRALLVNLLSVPERDRIGPAYALHREMMIRLWPEVLKEPINPPLPPSLRAIARGFLRRPGCMNGGWLAAQIANWLGLRLSVASPGPEA
jgi:hypothetical protein